MGLYDSARSLAESYVENVHRNLAHQGRPETKVDSGVSVGEYSFEGQEIDRDTLKEIKEIRESGGVISHLVHAKALMQFGTGVTFETENEELQTYLEENFEEIDNLAIDVGEDAIWYPYGPMEIVETMGGDFSHVEPIEPWTITPKVDEYGEILVWQQYTGNTREPDVFQPDEIASIILNKSCARDNTGISEVLRAEEEIRGFRENRQNVNKAIEYLIPHNHWIVGSDSGAIIDDNELRRVRNLIQDMDGDTQFVTGPDVTHEPIELGTFDFGAIQERGLRELALALGLPLELANVGSDGLGSGMPAELRLTLFERQARAAQRAFADQFKEQILVPVLEEYSQFNPETEDFHIRFGDPIEEEERSFSDIAPYLKLNEIRERLDMPEEEDPELGDTYRKPANVQAPDEEEPEDGIGGIFSDRLENKLDKKLGDSKNVKRGELEDALAHSEEWDSYLLTIHQRIWDAESEKQLLEIDDHDVPEFAKERLKDAIRGGAVFHEFDTIPSSELMQLRTFLIEQLEDGNWNIDGIANRLQDLDANLSFDEAERIARTETQATVAEAREIGYKERGDEDDLYYWTGVLDGRQTKACEWLINETNPHHNGNPVTLEELKELVQEAPEHDPDINTEPRKWTPHINCRKTYVRHVA